MVLYTCPAGETALLKTLTLVNNFGINNAIALKLNGTTNAAAILETVVAPNEGTVLTELFIVLEPGDILRGIAANASVIFAGFGAELEGVAD